MPRNSTRPAAEDLLARARRWQRHDPDPATVAALEEVIARADAAELAELFGGRLAFGTAGLRAPLGPGPRRMNRLVVRQSGTGIARVLLDDVPGAGTRGVIVAHDARHRSQAFATELTEVVTAHGIDVHRFDGPVPTPLAAFALRHLGAAAALVVTASHNPAGDNGLKVFWEDGAQIVPPLDSRIAAAIEAAAEEGPGPVDAAVGRVTSLGGVKADAPVVAAYLEAAAGCVGGRRPDRPVPIAVTALHGVGAELLDLTLSRLGHGPLHHVASQRRPDPDFPTVASPNPEEPEALGELLALAASVGAGIAMATDPDADRMALAAPRPDGRWQALTGDETGVLLAHHLLGLTATTQERLVVTSVVSSRLLEAMARASGVHFAETLTGFKWLSRPAMAHPGWSQVLAYEEALGYAVGPSTRDKDGVTASLVAADMACALAAAGSSVWEVLDALARAHGVHVSRNGAEPVVARRSPERPDPVGRPGREPPVGLGGFAVVSHDRPAHDVLRLWLEDRTRVVIRPSGTEPRIKYYCEAIEEVAGHETVERARLRALGRLEAVVADVRGLLA